MARNGVRSGAAIAQTDVRTGEPLARTGEWRGAKLARTGPWRGRKGARSGVWRGAQAQGQAPKEQALQTEGPRAQAPPAKRRRGNEMFCGRFA
jgi:hypothetical protein